jgi:hypothetical protein
MQEESGRVEGRKPDSMQVQKWFLAAGCGVVVKLRRRVVHEWDAPTQAKEMTSTQPSTWTSDWLFPILSLSPTELLFLWHVIHHSTSVLESSDTRIMEFLTQTRLSFRQGKVRRVHYAFLGPGTPNIGRRSTDALFHMQCEIREASLSVERVSRAP